MPPRLSTDAPRRLELFPIAKPQPMQALAIPRARRTWQPWAALILTLTGLLFSAVAMHRELKLQTCPTAGQVNG